MHYAYLSDKFEKDAKQFSLSGAEREALIQELREGVLRKQDMYAAGVYAKRFRGQRLRIIVWERPVGAAECAFVALKIYGVDEPEFKETFAKNPKDTALAGIDVAELERSIEFHVDAERRQAGGADIPALSDLERKFLEATPRFARENAGDFVLETEKWVTAMADPAILQHSLTIYALVQSAHKGSPSNLIQKTSAARVTVYFLRADTVKERVLLLIEVALDRGALEPYVPAEDVGSAIAEQLLKTSSCESLKRISRRCYPELLLYGENEWLDMERAGPDEANLALSVEELEVLASMARSPIASGGSRDGFPVFVNGRPGTGKSTVLHYAFAEYVFQYISANDGDATSSVESLHPIFLTYSHQLLERAKCNVEALLRLNATKVADGTAIALTAITRQTFDRCFCSFRSFLLEQLPSEQRQRFDGPLESQARDVEATGFVEFSRFKRLVQGVLKQHTVRKKVSPELAWHVIRTYIKGWHVAGEGYMRPEDYFGLSRRQRTVEPDTFKLVHDYVWKNYMEQCEKNGLWDDQDLAAAVLESNQPRGFYAAVFCDEAQDFTNVELELVSRLSLFTNRKLDASWQVAKVPVAFAGDPFQTLNPTGFKWEDVRASYFGRVRDALAHIHETVTVQNARDLTYNYRSSAGIVAFCNLLQLTRGLVLSIPDLEPQTAWRYGGISPPYAMDIGNSIVMDMIRAEDKAVVIVNCFGNDVADYVENDEFLSTFAFSNDRRLTRTVVSPAQTKGLEFDAVILYKFGASVLIALPSIATTIESACKGEASEGLYPEERDRLPFEYFFNRLYVAASRARKSLLIVDTKEGFDNFWAAMVPRDGGVEKACQVYAERYAKGPSWTNHVAAIQFKNDLTVDSKLADLATLNKPIDLAEQFEKQGDADNDADALRLASVNYSLANESARATRCEARASELLGEWRAAGDLYKSLKFSYLDDALRCFWRCEAFEQIREVCDSEPRKRGYRYKVAQFLTQSSEEQHKNAHDALKEVTGALSLLPDAERAAAIRDNVLSAALNRIIDLIDIEAVKAEAERIYADVDYLKRKGYAFGKPGSAKQRAHLAYCTGKYSECGKLLDEIRDPGINTLSWVKDARQKTHQTLSDKVGYLVANGNVRSAWALVQEDQTTALTNRNLFRFFQWALEQNNIADCIKVLRRALPGAQLEPKDVDSAVELLVKRELGKEPERTHANDLRELALHYLIANHRIQEAYEFCTSGARRTWSGAVKSKMAELEEPRSRWRVAFISQMARIDIPTDKLALNQRREVSRQLVSMLRREAECARLIEAGLGFFEGGGCLERLGDFYQTGQFYRGAIGNPRQWNLGLEGTRLAMLRHLRVLWCERESLSGDRAREKEGEIRVLAKEYGYEDIAKNLQHLRRVPLSLNDTQLHMGKRNVPSKLRPTAAAISELGHSPSKPVESSVPLSTFQSNGGPRSLAGMSFFLNKSGKTFAIQRKSGRRGQVFIDVSPDGEVGEIRIIPASNKVQWQEEEGIAIPSTNGLHRVEEWGLGVSLKMLTASCVIRFVSLDDGGEVFEYVV